MSKIKALAHVCIRTTDLARCEAFYCGQLGMEKVFRFLRKGEVIGFYLKVPGGAFVEVFLTDVIENLGRQALNHFCLETEDIRALHQELTEQGYAPRELKMGVDGTWQFWMNDPDGLALEFQEYTENSAQFTKADVEVNW